MNIGDRSRAPLIIKATISLIVKGERTCRVRLFHIHLYLRKFLIPIRLVRHRPEDNGGMIPVELDHLHIDLQYIGIIFLFAVIQYLPVLIRMMAKPANRSLYLDKHPQLVAHLQHLLTRWIMRCTDEVTVSVPIQLNIFSCQRRIHHTACQRMHLMTAHTFQLNRLSIY